jgi:hypothetical protein
MMAEMSKRDASVVATKAETLRGAFFAHMDIDAFTKSITYGPNTPKEVRARFRMASDMFREVFDA